jgi:pimeloyl-ACP methyl ester carboxylesterase
MAAMSPDRLRGLILVAPLGVQPLVGEITDPFLVSTERYVQMGFARLEDYKSTFGDSYELGSEPWLRRERNREMTTRIAWKPRMFDQTLPFRLPYVSTPTLILWGEQDAILARNSVERYRDSIPGAELVTLPEAGHMPECEAPGTVSKIVAGFIETL